MSEEIKGTKLYILSVQKEEDENEWVDVYWCCSKASVENVAVAFRSHGAQTQMREEIRKPQIYGE